MKINVYVAALAATLTSIYAVEVNAAQAIKAPPITPAPGAQGVKLSSALLKGPDQQAMPDLAFQSYKRVGAKVEAVAVNIGGAVAGQRTRATLFMFEPDKPVRYESLTVPALAPGATFSLPFTLVGRGAFQIHLDAGQVLSESDENNNLTPIVAAATSARREASRDPLAAASRMRDTLRQRYVSADGTVQPLAAAATPEGAMLVFPENELTIRAPKAEAEALAARVGGTIIDEIKAPAGWSWGSLYVIRVDPVAPAPGALSPQEAQTIFSSDRARNLLTIAKAENRKGARLGVNLLIGSDGYLEMTTKEALDISAFALDYMQAGGPFDVDVATAWKMLAYAGKTKSKTIRLGLLDNGFGVGRTDWLEMDLDVLASLDAAGPNKGNCGAGNPCPWHGVNAAEAAAAIADDQRGMAGPAAPVAQVLLFDRGGMDLYMTIKRLWKLNEMLPHIINMSFGGRIDRDSHFFEGAWINIVEDFELATAEIAEKGDRLIIASAGNDGFDIDLVNSDGKEMHWQNPCENQGVICVGGWRDFSNGPDFDGKPYGIEGGVWGKMRAVSSNYATTPRGETVDIWGPWCTRVGDDFDNRGADATKLYCGTSAAAPVVSGVAALIWAANPKLSSKSVWQLMFKHAINAGQIRRVHAREAVREALMTTGEKYKPDVEITTPIEGKTFAAVGDISLGYSAFDIEDGNKCCTAEWFIDNLKVGGSGSGQPLIKASLDNLSLGTHVVKVKITDADGFWDEASAKFTLKNDPPSISVAQLGNSAVQQVTESPNFYEVKIKDDTLPFGPGPEECKKVVWTDSLGAMTVKHKSGCRFDLRYSTPGKRTVTVEYSDKFGAKASTSFSAHIEKLSGFKVRIVEPMTGDVYDPSDVIIIEVETLNAKEPVTFVWQLLLTGTGAPKMQPLTPTPLGGNRFSFRVKDVFPWLGTSTEGGTLELRMVAESAAGWTSYDSVKFKTSGLIK